MAEGTTRRPLPALICLLALTLLTALVWWRVLNRNDSHASTTKVCSTSAAPVVLPRPAALSVTVLNSTNRAQLAKKTAAVLAKDGFVIATYGNDTTLVAGVAEIRYSADQQPGASLLGYYFSGARMVPLDANSESKLVVALGAKFVTVSAPAAVQAAITAAHASQAPVGSTSVAAPTTPTC
ncbi:MAG TPA: LytR C-terminal domain-containing protein [Jatrophihabitantaceae bacterium]|jgi:hypothetical protein|nr:LytR C-terminal domain-containing protein [Jatrophihabitantaceae bacterium]